MADTKITGLTADTSLVDADLVPTVTDVSTTPANRKMTAANFAASAPFSTRYQALAAVLTATTASFLTADETKLDGIEALADVTDATNVNAAGAVMESDYDANTVLAATADNTPVPLTLGASTILARLAAGGIVAATPAELRTLLALVIGTNVQAWDADLDALASAGNSTVLAATTASFLTADETKLDGIETAATADQTAAEILAALLTVDGAGSGLDADTLDGSSSAAFETPSGAQSKADAKVTQVITNGVTTTAPSEDAMFDALALKAPLASPTFTGTVTLPNQTIDFDALDYEAILATQVFG